MSRAVELLRRSCPGCVTENWMAESNRAVLRLAQNRYEEADHLFTHVLALRETAEALRSLAVVREKERPHQDAILLIDPAHQVLAQQIHFSVTNLLQNPLVHE